MENKQTNSGGEKKFPRPGKKQWIVMGIVVGCLVALYLTLCAVAAAGEAKTLPRTTVAGISLGGMTQEEAAKTLTDAMEERRSSGQYVVFAVAEEDGSQVKTVQVPTSCLQLDEAASAQAACQLGAEAGFLEGGVVYLNALFTGAEVAPVFGDSSQLDELLTAELDGTVGYPAVDASYAVTDTELQIVKGTPGFEVDKEALKGEILTWMGRGETVEEGAAEAQFTVQRTETQPQGLDFAAISQEISRPPQDAYVDQATGKIILEQNGVSITPEEAQRTYDGLGWGETGTLALTITPPAVSRTDLPGVLYRDILGTCTSQVGGSSNRLSNVKLAAQLCNDVVLQPGEEFSYNGTVGRRTAERGFLGAPAYVGGKTVTEIGGGICQMSSTLYLATLRSNLEIVERSNHGYTVGYLPNGLDATVYYGSLDYRFKNNTDFPIKIAASVSGRTLTVNIYGTKNDNITVDMETVTVGTKGYNTVYKIDNSVAVGSTKVDVTPYSGCTVKVYRCLYENGALISRELESTDTYKSRDKVVLVNSADGYKYGLGPAPTPAPVPPTTEASATDPAAGGA